MWVVQEHILDSGKLAKFRKINIPLQNLSQESSMLECSCSKSQWVYMVGAGVTGGDEAQARSGSGNQSSG